MSVPDCRDVARCLILVSLVLVSVLAGTPLGASTASAAGSITVTQYMLVEDQGFTKEPLTASVTVNNTNSSEQTKHVVIEKYDEYSGTWETVGSKDVTVGANSERTVNVTYFVDSKPKDGDATIRVNGLSNTTVAISRSPTYVRETSTNTSSVTAGETVETTVTVRNHGSVTVDRRVTLQWGSRSTSSTVVTIRPESQKMVTFSPSLTIPGVQVLKAGYTPSEPVRVTNKSIDVSTSGRTLQTPTIFTGEYLRSNVTLTNNGPNTTKYAVTLRANTSEQRARYRTKIVTLTGGDRQNVSVRKWINIPGEYTVELNGRPVSNATVRLPYNATNLSFPDSSIIAGQPTTVTLELENRKSTQIHTDIEIEQKQRSYWRSLIRTDVTLNASETKQLALTTTFDTAGTHVVRAGNSGQQTVEVVSALDVSNVSMPSEPVYTAEPVSINATVTNRLDTSTKKTLLIEAKTDYGWRNITAKEIQLEAGETKRVAIPVVFDNAESKVIRIGQDEQQNLTVQDTPATVANVVVSDRSIEAGNQTTITATIYNWGENGTEFRATLNIDGNQYDSNSRQIHKSVYVPVDQKKTVTFNPTFSVGGSHSIAVRYRDAGIISVADSNVSVVGGNVASDVVYKRDTTPVSVTLKNTADTARSFAVTAQADKNTSRWYTETTTKIVTVEANAQVTKTVDVRPYSVGNYTIVVNGQTVDSLEVKRGVKVDAVEISDRVVTVGETFYFNQTLRNPTSTSRTYYAQVEDASYRTDVSAGTTKQVSRQLSFGSPGVKRIWADGRSYRVIAIADTTGSANVSLTRAYTPRKVVNGSTEGFFATLQNTGDATAVRNVSVSINGTNVASERVYLPANSTRNVYLEHTFIGLGDYHGALNVSQGPNKQFNGTVRTNVVVDGSATISYVSGTEPDSLPVVDAAYRGGSIYLKVTQNGHYVRNLSALGADSTTKFNISFRTKNYEPRIVVGNGRDVALNVSDAAQKGQQRVSIEVKPSQLDYKYDFEGQRPSSPEEWSDAVQNNSADFGWETAIQLRVGNAKTVIDSVNSSTLSGMTVSTDAQMYSMPRYVPNTSDTSPHLEVSLAAPHETINGNVNEGYYIAFLPDDLLSAWNVTNPTQQLSASYQDQDINMTVTETTDGAIVNISLHYSSGTLEIAKRSATDSTTGDTESGGSAAPAGGDSTNSQSSQGSQQTQTTTTTTTTTATSTPATSTTTTSPASTTTLSTRTDTSTTTDPSVTTTPNSTTGSSTDPTTRGSTPGFGLLTAILAAGVALGLRRY